MSEKIINEVENSQTAAFTFNGDRFDLSFQDNMVLLQLLEIGQSIIIFKKPYGYDVGIGDPENEPTWVMLRKA